MMKVNKIAAFLLIYAVVVCSLLCCAFAAADPYTVERNGIVYQVDAENRTISDGENVYVYSIDGNDTDYTINITYPDGSSYWWAMSGVMGSGGWSDDYVDGKYADASVLKGIILEGAPKTSKHSGGSVTAIIFLIALGIFNIAAPRTAWYLEYGWRYKGAEPSDMALIFNRLAGIVAIIVAVVIIL